MSNYHEGCVKEITNPDLVGVGSGTAPDGSKRICIGLEGQPLEWQGEEWKRLGWHSLTLPCARELYKLLDMNKHLWE